MRWSWKIGRLAGINLYMHATFLLLILFVMFVYWTDGHSIAKSMVGVGFVLVIFACIVFHELGHALTARKYGVQTRDIVLLPIGGVARLERMPEKPREELWVALAGPAVNVVIAGILLAALVAAGVHLQWSDLRGVGGNFIENVMVVNLWLVGFNLLPAFPMDGGRVLRALLASRMEPARATQLAARVGKAMALLFGVAGLFGDPFLVFIAIFVWMGADAEGSMALMKTSVAGVPVQQVMVKEFTTLRPDDSLARAAAHSLDGWQQDFPVVFGDHVLGVLTREDLRRALAEKGPELLVRDVMRRDFLTADSHDAIDRALAMLQVGKCSSLPVEHEGRLVGMITADNISHFIAMQSALRRQKDPNQDHHPPSRQGPRSPQEAKTRDSDLLV
ncbi:MAG: site-2 protease family protein [Terriglobia bacterium]